MRKKTKSQTRYYSFEKISQFSLASCDLVFDRNVRVCINVMRVYVCMWFCVLCVGQEIKVGKITYSSSMKWWYLKYKTETSTNINLTHEVHYNTFRCKLHLKLMCYDYLYHVGQKELVLYKLGNMSSMKHTLCMCALPLLYQHYL